MKDKKYYYNVSKRKLVRTCNSFLTGTLEINKSLIPNLIQERYQSVDTSTGTLKIAELVFSYTTGDLKWLEEKGINMARKFYLARSKFELSKSHRLDSVSVPKELYEKIIKENEVEDNEED